MEFPEWDQWLGAAIALIVGVSIALVVRWLLRRLARRHDSDARTTAFSIVARVLFAVIIAIAIYIALEIIGVDLGPVLAGAGIAGIVLAFALKDIVQNYVSGILMGFRSPFIPGDEIISGDYEGVVEELNLRYTTLRTYDGVRVYLPNGEVLQNAITNLTTNGTRRTQFSIGVAYGSDIELARQRIIDAVTSVDAVDGDQHVYAWVKELAPSSITIGISYWHDPRTAEVSKVRNSVMIATLSAMTEAGIDMPYPRQVIDVATMASTD